MINFLFKFQTVLLRLCDFIVCCLFFIYGLLEAVIEKCLLNSFLFRLSKILEKYLWKYLLLRKLRAVGPLTLLILTLSQICFKNSAKIYCFRKWLINVQLAKRMCHSTSSHARSNDYCNSNLLSESKRRCQFFRNVLTLGVLFRILRKDFRQIYWKHCTVINVNKKTVFL